MDTFWVAVGFLIFMGILWKAGVHTMILSALDARGEKVAAELNQAKRLREEAEKLLAEYAGKQKAAEAEAAQIIADAKALAAQLASDAKARLDEFVKRRTIQAEQKIAQAEASAAADVRAAASDLAARAAETMLRGDAGAQAAAGLLAAGIREVRAKLN